MDRVSIFYSGRFVTTDHGWTTMAAVLELNWLREIWVKEEQGISRNATPGGF